MTIDEILTQVREKHDVVVRDKTFRPRSFETVVLDTGENIYWVYGQDGMWLSLDPGGEEILQFEDINEEIEPEDDVVVYGGDDYEFSYEGSATIKDDDTAALYRFREFENANGLRIRSTEDEGNGDKTIASGYVVTEEEIQEA